MTVTFTVGSMPAQIPIEEFIQDSIFSPNSQVDIVIYNGQPLPTMYWYHEPTEWRLYWGEDMMEGDEITISVSKLQ